jgi:hypothetical protein
MAGKMNGDNGFKRAEEKNTSRQDLAKELKSPERCCDFMAFLLNSGGQGNRFTGLKPFVHGFA